MFRELFKTDNNISATILRLVLGVVLLGHGSQKMLGWFGGYGFDGTMQYFTDSVGIPWIIGCMVIVIEFIGAISLILGFATRLWSISMAFMLAGVIYHVHWQNGFFMNWFGNQKGEGYEYFLLAIAMAVSLVITGAGSFSIDRYISAQTSKTAPEGLLSNKDFGDALADV